MVGCSVAGIFYCVAGAASAEIGISHRAWRGLRHYRWSLLRLCFGDEEVWNFSGVMPRYLYWLDHHVFLFAR